MSKRKKYYFNDGLDGIVIARSLKHAISILRRNGYYNFTKQEIIKANKTGNEINGCSWYIDKYNTKGKRSKMVGWCE